MMYLYRAGVFAAALVLSQLVFAEECKKTLMGSDCASNESGVASHMRGNAVENAKASKALQEAKRKARKDAIAIGAAKKNNAAK